MKLSIVIPAYNEELRLFSTLNAYASYFQEHLKDDFEIIVVVNHSADRTEEVALGVARRFAQVSVMNEPERIGKGGAVLMGLRVAAGDYIGFVDADGATPVTSFSQLMEQIGDGGCAIGSRWIEGAQVHPRQSLMRRFASRLLNHVFARGLFGLQVYDSQCGAKLFARDILLPLLPELKERGWAFDIDILCRIKRAGSSIRELPIEWHHVPGNPINFMLMSMQMLVSVWRVKRALARM